MNGRKRPVYVFAVLGAAIIVAVFAPITVPLELREALRVFLRVALRDASVLAVTVFVRFAPRS